MESAGIFHPTLLPSGSRSVSGWIIMMLMQSGVELMTAFVLRHSNAIVSEMSLIFATLLTALSPPVSQESFQITYVRFVALCVGMVAVRQYFAQESINKERSLVSSKYQKALRFEPVNRRSPKTLLFLLTIVLTSIGSLVQLCFWVDRLDGVFVTEDRGERFELRPVQRSRLNTTDDDFYEEGFSIVIPTYMPHRHFVANLFKSMQKYCIDCEKVKFLLVVGKNTEQDFESMRSDFPFLKRMEVKSFTDIYPDLTNPFFNLTEETFVQNGGKHTYQSMKKLYGCLYMNTKYCWMLDSEAFMFQETSIKNMVESYFHDPHIVFSSHDRADDPATKAARNILGYGEHFGWALEEYLWFMELEPLKKIKDIIDAKFPTTFDLPKLIFIEVTYFWYIIHNIHDYPEYRVVDSANILGEMWEEAKKTTKGMPLGPIEDTRHVIAVSPSIIRPLAARFYAYGITFFKVSGLYGTIDTSADFLDLATSVKMCVSEQTPELFQMAMEGRWANRNVSGPVVELEDFCRDVNDNETVAC
ncbi:hypothetical protein HDU97_006907 [Phlyctochytrium planicorne]|nr:hypothetical protein HDU97_006907 [Phlyctochytrium planicorne]